MRQGDGFSPLLFKIALEKVIRTTSRENGGVQVRMEHKILAYGDDIPVIGNNDRGVEKLAKAMMREAYRLTGK